ncbi:Alpha/beta hydrolase family protein [Leptospira interrogans serovar Canicola]|nr:Uncharacterized protein A9P81_3338 [Leptospira interrogans serovar Copenhageni/Icterohaemorrhagiae]OCC27932.1 Alpha/beta hydrolase family protein [Leptospira interrogans serovar Canicola]
MKLLFQKGSSLYSCNVLAFGFSETLLIEHKSAQGRSIKRAGIFRDLAVCRAIHSGE